MKKLPVDGPLHRKGPAHQQQMIDFDVVRPWKVHWNYPDSLPIAKLEELNCQAGQSELFGPSLFHVPNGFAY